MQKIIVFLFVLFSGCAVFAQDADSVADLRSKKESKANWVCPACFKVSKVSGACVQDKTATIQLGTYYCQRCVKPTGTEAGQCPTCKGVTTQMTKKLIKQHKEPVKRTA
jgi:hypothetical protein